MKNYFMNELWSDSAFRFICKTLPKLVTIKIYTRTIHFCILIFAPDVNESNHISGCKVL